MKRGKRETSEDAVVAAEVGADIRYARIKAALQRQSRWQQEKVAQPNFLRVSR
jgi:hypothetical protein